MPDETEDEVNGGPFAATEIAERLLGGQGADFARELRAHLDTLQNRLRAEMRAGVPAGQFEAYARVADALASAASVVIRAGNAKARRG